MPGEFIWVSTRRIGQITGVLDPQGWPLLTDTRRWGVDGVDLGVNTEHHGRLYILFGDVAVTDTVNQKANSDLIAWTTDVDVLERGGHWAPAVSWHFFLPSGEHGASGYDRPARLALLREVSFALLGA